MNTIKSFSLFLLLSAPIACAMEKHQISTNPTGPETTVNRSALEHAVRSGHTEVVEAIIKAAAGINKAVISIDNSQE